MAFGSGGAVAFWLVAAIVGAIDSIPVVSTLSRFIFAFLLGNAFSDQSNYSSQRPWNLLASATLYGSPLDS